jgi:hypothetical protein
MTTEGQDETTATNASSPGDASGGSDFDELAHKRAVTHLAASIVDHATRSLLDFEAMQKTGLSMEDALREVWRALPMSATHLVPEAAFVQAISVMVNTMTAIRQGDAAKIPEMVSHVMAQDPHVNAGFMAGQDFARQQIITTSEARRHKDQDRLRTFVKRTIATSEVACRVMLQSGGSFDGFLSETQDGLLMLEQDQEVGEADDEASVAKANLPTCVLFFPYSELSSIVLFVERDDSKRPPRDSTRVILSLPCRSRSRRSRSRRS